MKNFLNYYKCLNEAEPGTENPMTPVPPIPATPQTSDNTADSFGQPPVPEDDKKTKEQEKKEREKRAKERVEKKYLEARQNLIDQYTDENKDSSWIVLKPVKDSTDAVIPLFTIDISMDPYLDRHKFELGKIEKKIDDQLDYNDIFVKDIEHMARKHGIETIIWKTDSHGSKYFKIKLGS